MRITTNTGGNISFGVNGYENSCKKTRCLKKGEIKCKYCGDKYCKEHIAPLPFMRRKPFGNKGHECVKFPENKSVDDIVKQYPYLEEEIKPNIEQSFKEKESIEYEPLKETKRREDTWVCEKCEKEFKTKREAEKCEKTHGKKFNGWIIAIVIIVIIGSIFYAHLPKIYYSLAGNPDFGGIIENPLENKEISDYAFNLWNEYRFSKQTHSFDFNKEAYNLAVFASKYYSEERLTLTETKLDIKASEYDLFNPKILYFTATNTQEAKTQIEIWKQNEVISNLLIDDSYFLGAIGCFKETCAIVLSNDY